MPQVGNEESKFDDSYSDDVSGACTKSLSAATAATTPAPSASSASGYGHDDDDSSSGYSDAFRVHLKIAAKPGLTLPAAFKKRKRPGVAPTASTAFADDDEDDSGRNHRTGPRLLSLAALSDSDEKRKPNKGNDGPKDTSKRIGDDDDENEKTVQHETSQMPLPAVDDEADEIAAPTQGRDDSISGNELKDNHAVQEEKAAGGETDHKGDSDGSNTESQTSPQQQQQQQQQSKSQPEGWRVKLYRLNGDGSWDDCGTGRILCLYKPTPNHTNQGPRQNQPTANAVNMSTGDAWAYHELGEPTLCMHSEAPNNNSPNNGGCGGGGSNNNTTNGHNNKGDGHSAGQPRILLRTRILLRDAYQRQGDNIITWCEPYSEEGANHQGVDLALSFQDNSGCLDIWRQITQVQNRASDLFRRRGSTPTSPGGSGCGGDSGGSSINSGHDNSIGPRAASGSSVTDVARAVAAAHHASLQQQDEQEMWVSVASEAQQQQRRRNESVAAGEGNGVGGNGVGRDRFEDEVGGMVSAYHEASGSCSGSGGSVAGGQSPQLPNPPNLSNLEEIADTIAAVQHIQQRESLSMYIAQDDCSYLKALLSLFPKAEDQGDYGSLATLAACVKTILLLNDPSIIELVAMDGLIFEEVCATMEYDPDLRDKANHRWFLRARLKFRTVALMEDEELVSAIHRSFRVNYLRDTLLRPTMDESSLSTLSSLQTFTHADVVKGVTMSPTGSDDEGELLRDSYLAKVIRILGRELDAICHVEWREMENLPQRKTIQGLIARRFDEPLTDPSTVVAPGKYQKNSTIWKQHLAPQDGSMESRRIRRRGALTFLRELFNMVRVSLQQTDRDDFFAVLVSMDVDLSYDQENHLHHKKACNNDTPTGDGNERDTATLKDGATNNRKAPPPTSSKPVNLISLMATVLSHPETDIAEKGSVLEIIAGIAMHDPSLIRKRCLDFFASWKQDQKEFGEAKVERMGPSRPKPNELDQVIFQAPPNDLLSALLFLLATETDAGILLQISEIMRIILDTDVMGDHSLMTTGFADEAEGIPPSGGHNPPHDQHPNPTGNGNPTSTEQNQFLLMFYDHYIQWLAAPFQYTMFYPLLRFPTSLLAGETESEVAKTMQQRFDKGMIDDEPLLCAVPFCAMRCSFAVELLSFCVRAHLFRMKFYLLRSRVLWNVLKLLKPSSLPRNTSGDRCLKLATLRFLRAVLSVNDDSYHRHIIQFDLFGPVFEAFRANPVGDNLVSSSIVEMCDYINTENINTLIEYIVTKHLSAISVEATPVPSLEDVSSPYVTTLTLLRKAYEKLLEDRNSGNSSQTEAQDRPGQQKPEQSRYFSQMEEEEYFS